MTVFRPPGLLPRDARSTYELVVLDPLGTAVSRRFSPDNPATKGDITASASPLTGCGTLQFSGRPDVLGLEGGEVLQLFLNAGDGLKPRFYGAVETAYPAEKADSVKAYTASAADLLERSSCGAQVYANLDCAAIAYDLASKHRHPALKVRVSDFPATGVLREEYAAPGLPLKDALDELAKLAADSGVEVGGGVDFEGFVFFRSNTDVLELEYTDDMFAGLPTNVLGGIVTQVDYIFGGLPSLGDSYAGGYRPQALIYSAVPDAELHERYRSPAGEPVPEGAWQNVPDAVYTASGFTNVDNATRLNPAGFATRTGTTGKPFVRFANTDPWVFGLLLRYLTSADVPEMTLRITPMHEGGLGPYYEVPIPKSEGEIKTLPIKLPPARATALGAFLYFAQLQLTVPSGGTFELHQAHLLRIDAIKLDALSAQRLVVPARRPQQVLPRRLTPTGPRSYIAELTSTVTVLNSPIGTQTGKVAAARYAWIESDDGIDVETVIDLEQQAGSDESEEVRALEQRLVRDLHRERLVNAGKQRI